MVVVYEGKTLTAAQKMRILIHATAELIYQRIKSARGSIASVSTAAISRYVYEKYGFYPPGRLYAFLYDAFRGWASVERKSDTTYIIINVNGNRNKIVSSVESIEQHMYEVLQGVLRKDNLKKRRKNTRNMPRTLANEEEKMTLISVHLPKPVLYELDELVRKRIFPSRSEAIRIAIVEFLLKYKDKIGTGSQS